MSGRHSKTFRNKGFLFHSYLLLCLGVEWSVKGDKPNEIQSNIVEIKRQELESICRVLGDACEVIRSFYPGANWVSRKGARLMMDEICKAEDSCRQVLYPQKSRGKRKSTV